MFAFEGKPIGNDRILKAIPSCTITVYLHFVYTNKLNQIFQPYQFDASFFNFFGVGYVVFSFLFNFKKGNSEVLNQNPQIMMLRLTWDRTNFF